MNTKKHLIWILSASLLLGALLASLDGGTWWIGFLAYSLVLSLGLIALASLWRKAGSPRALLVMLLLALFLRFGTGLFFFWALPNYGNNSETHNAGYIFRDASTYDEQSWGLAVSGEPLWSAFDRSSGIEEQYGGLTLLLSSAYRFLSPDRHRAWLTMLISAMAGAAAVFFTWKGGQQAWGERAGWVLGWIMTLYPESLLAGASQIREPFLTLFMTAAFCRLTAEHDSHPWKDWVWLAVCFLGALLFSPGVAIFGAVVLAVWVWLGGRELHVRWWWLAGGGAFIFGVAFFLGVMVSGTLQAPAGPLANLVNWLRYSAMYSASQTELSSGWIQVIFKDLPAWLHLPFITAYGVIQPLLPAAIIDAAVWPSRLLGILRGLGWYALLPLLVYSLYPILKTSEKRAMLTWLWLWGTAWVWIVVCSFRAGGDQWDNPRYRLMMLLFQGGLAAYALLWAREVHDRWLWRTLAIEGVMLVTITAWYISRYDASPDTLPIGWTMAIAVSICALILLAGVLKDRSMWRNNNKNTH